MTVLLIELKPQKMRDAIIISMLLVCISVFMGCNKDADANLSCDLSFPFPAEVEWEPTSVLPTECRWMLFKHAYRGEYFYSVGNHCVDMVPFVATCDGVNICMTASSRCERILDDGINLGIVAVEKE